MTTSNKISEITDLRHRANKRGYSPAILGNVRTTDALQKYAILCGITIEDLRSNRKGAGHIIMHRRHLVWWILRGECKMSYPEIAVLTGGVHSSVISALRQFVSWHPKWLPLLPVSDGHLMTVINGLKKAGDE